MVAVSPPRQWRASGLGVTLFSLRVRRRSPKKACLDFPSPPLRQRLPRHGVPLYIDFLQKEGKIRGDGGLARTTVGRLGVLSQGPGKQICKTAELPTHLRPRKYPVNSPDGTLAPG